MGWFDDNAPTAQPTGTAGMARSAAAPIPGGGNTIAQQTAGGGTGGEDPQAVFNELMAGKPITLETMQAIEPMLRQRTGAMLEYNARGNAADLKLPSGQIVDVVSGLEGPEAQRALQWDTSTGAPGGMADGYSLQGANGLASFSAPGLNAPYTQQFQAPTGTDDPGFQFAMEQGQEGLERSAAARGTLLTGGTLKDLAKYTTGMALQGYGDAWNRSKNVYDTNRGTFWGNQDRAYSKLSGAAGIGADAAGAYAANTGALAQQGANINATQTGVQNQNWQNTFGTLAEMGTAYAKDRLNKRKPGIPATPVPLPVSRGDALPGGAYA